MGPVGPRSPQRQVTEARPEYRRRPLPVANVLLGVHPTIQALTDVICSLAHGKTIGPERFFVELFKITLNGDPALRLRLIDIVICILTGSEVPQQKYAIITVLHKKERSDRVRQLQGHPLIAHGGRILLKIIARRLSEYCECVEILSEVQSGFRPNRSITDMMFVVRRLDALARKKRIPLYLCFIDLTKAYGSVD